MNETLEKQNTLPNAEAENTISHGEEYHGELRPSYEGIVEIPKSSHSSKRVKKRKAVAVCTAVLAVLFIAIGIYTALYAAVPHFELRGGEDITVEIKEQYDDYGVTAKVFGVDISGSVQTDKSSVNTEIPGKYTVHYSLSFFGKNYSLMRVVTVADTVPPVITLAESTETVISSIKNFKEPGYTAHDSFDGDLTSAVKVKITAKNGIATVEYTVADSSGNVGSATRQIRLSDTKGPSITLIGGYSISTGEGVFTDPGATAADDADGDITKNIKVTTDYKAGKEGTFTFTYTVSDSSGNTATAVRKVTVKDQTPPVITLGGYKEEFILVGDKFTDSGATAEDSFDGKVNVNVSGNVDTSKAGTYTLTYTAADSKGYSTSATRVIKVIKSPVPVEGAVNGGGIVSDSTIYLTFDDGPSTNITPQILDVLKKNNVKVTFFIVGYGEKDKAVIARAIAEGHTIAIHGMGHDYSKIYASAAACIENITSLQEKIERDFGYTTNIIRFPGGSSNVISAQYCQGVMTTLSSLVVELGFTYFDWNVDSGDATGKPYTPAEIAANVTSTLHKNRANVVLMHDSTYKQTTADSLQMIIDYGKANGYTFAGISSYTPPVRHGINN